VAQNPSNQPTSGREVTQGSQGGGSQSMTRRQANFPSMFTLNPIEFLTMSPFALMQRFSEEFDRSWSEGSATSTARQGPMWSPAIEVRQEGNDLHISADLPGLKPEDVQVEMTDQGLAIHGERRREHEENRQGFHRTERSYGRFYRLIPLPESVDDSKVRADFRDGVLEIHVPVPQQRDQRRRIQVQSGGHQQQPGASTTQGSQSTGSTTSRQGSTTPQK
jgi:HSP20 family protein